MIICNHHYDYKDSNACSDDDDDDNNNDDDDDANDVDDVDDDDVDNTCRWVLALGGSHMPLFCNSLLPYFTQTNPTQHDHHDDSNQPNSTHHDHDDDGKENDNEHKSSYRCWH